MIRELTAPVGDREEIKGGDWVEWKPGAWTRIDPGCEWIGATPESVDLKFRRDLSD